MPTTDSYSHRLVAGRRLYDHGAVVQAVPSLAGLVGAAPLRANPHDLDDLGLGAGGRVRVKTARASAVFEVAPDPALPRRVVAVDFNVPLADGTAGDLIDSTHAGHRIADGDAMTPVVHAVSPLLATDPLFPTSNVGLAIFLIVLIKVLVVFGALMVAVMLMIWFERKVISDMQSRIGPNRAGPFGLLQTLADGIKLFFKEDLVPGTV